MIKLNIYTNDDKNEYAISISGDQVMRAETTHGINYPHLEGEYEIEAHSDLAFIDNKIREALKLHIDHIDNCCEVTTFKCCYCYEIIKAEELHCEFVLYAGGNEICMVAAYHNECPE